MGILKILKAQSSEIKGIMTNAKRKRNIAKNSLNEANAKLDGFIKTLSSQNKADVMQSCELYFNKLNNNERNNKGKQRYI